jgi:hypothetical protein
MWGGAREDFSALGNRNPFGATNAVFRLPKDMTRRTSGLIAFGECKEFSNA